MTLPAELLITPLRLLLTALGTGILPPGDPSQQLNRAAQDLRAVRAQLTVSTDAARSEWHGHGSDAALAASRSASATGETVDDDGEHIARLVVTASARVRSAAVELNCLIDSFERAAVALGGTLYTPAGLAALLPVAVEHIQRGLRVVARAQEDLAHDTREMAALARHLTPANARAPHSAVHTAPASAHGRNHDPSSGPGTDHHAAELTITLPDGSVAHAPNARAATAVRAALSQRGVPYVWGGTTPAGFDCSGLTQWAYHQAGLDLPRLAQDQDTAGVRVDQARLQPGDLAVWDQHVAMYIGNNQMIEAGDPVQVSPVRTTNAGQGFQGFFRPR
ncbi:MAG: C40 family peptidase [Gordonia sp. (in: high G+C Gram-positive bacteria)]